MRISNIPPDSANRAGGYIVFLLFLVVMGYGLVRGIFGYDLVTHQYVHIEIPPVAHQGPAAR